MMIEMTEEAADVVVVDVDDVVVGDGTDDERMLEERRMLLPVSCGESEECRW